MSAAKPSEKFTYAINWGDGTPVDSGPATIDVTGSPGTPTQARSTAATRTPTTASIPSPLPSTTTTAAPDSARRSKCVNNVAPALTVPPDQTVNEGALLSITDIGQFTDPGFDNPLNVGGETSEKFTYAIDWGDGTALDSGPATIDVTGYGGHADARFVRRQPHVRRQRHLYRHRYRQRRRRRDDSGHVPSHGQQRRADADRPAGPNGQRRVAAVDHRTSASSPIPASTIH